MTTFVTLGPSGSCHENATRRYAEFQGLTDVTLEFVDDFAVGLERIRGRTGTFLVQCSAHPNVHLITERYFTEVFVVDTFLHPTRELALVRRRDVAEPSSIGIVPATTGYVDMSRWSKVVYETSKPVVGRNLVEGRYDIGLTYPRFAEEWPDLLVVDQYIGEVDTTWLVYGTRRRYAGEVVGVRCPELFAPAG